MGLQTYHQMEDEAVILRHWHQQLCSCVSRCCWCCPNTPPAQPNTQDIRKIMREHIFSNLLTKTELLIAPCWLAIASEGHVPRCILKLSWRTFSEIYNCLVMDQGQGVRSSADYVNGFHLCSNIFSGFSKLNNQWMGRMHFVRQTGNFNLQGCILTI